MKGRMYLPIGLVVIALAIAFHANAQFTKGLVGKWVGKGTQSNGSAWSIELSVDAADNYSISYPSLSCGGTLALIEDAEGSARFREVITYGKGKCVDNGVVKLVRETPSRLAFLWYTPDGEKLDASGNITIASLEEAPNSLAQQQGTGKQSVRGSGIPSQPSSEPKALVHGKGDRLATFDLRGVKLGMLPDDVKGIIRHNGGHRDNYRQQNSAESDWNCAGTGCGTITDWQIDVSLTDEPYGSGVFDIRYKKQVLGSVDIPTFVTQLKDQLRQKYGNPTYDVNAQNRRAYFACWGNSCKKGIEKKIKDPCMQKSHLASNKTIPRDKYLVVRYDGGEMIYFSLFDMNPHYIQDELGRRGDVERAKQRIKF